MEYFLRSGLEHTTGVKEKHSPLESRLLFEEPLNGNRKPYQFNLFVFFTSNANVDTKIGIYACLRESFFCL